MPDSHGHADPQNSGPLAADGAAPTQHSAARHALNGSSALKAGGPGTPTSLTANSSVRAARSARVAVIDVGSNSIRLVVADCRFEPDRWASGDLTDASDRETELQTAQDEAKLAPRQRVVCSIVAEQRNATQLATGLDSTGRLDAKAMEQSAVSIRDMVTMATDLGVPQDRIRAIATCAVREAENRKEFVTLVKRWSGLKVKPISAKKEAKLAFSSARASFDLASLHPDGAAVIDIGGGSTEVILTGRNRRAGRIKRIFLLPTGSVRVTERFGGPDISGTDRYADMLSFARELAKRSIWELDRRPGVLIGVGGTVAALGKLLMAAGRRGANFVAGPQLIAADGSGIAGSSRAAFLPVAGGLTDPVQAMPVSQEDVESALLALRALDSQTRREVAGMTRDRADTIVGGLAILLAVMERLGQPALLVHTGGIRDGLLRRVARKELGRGGADTDASGLRLSEDDAEPPATGGPVTGG